MSSQRLHKKSTQVNALRPVRCANVLEYLDSGVAPAAQSGRLCRFLLVDPRRSFHRQPGGGPMANSDTPRSPSPGLPTVSRRDVLKGMAGVAGIASVPALIAACGPGASPSTSAAAPASAPASAPGSAAAGGAITLGSNYSDAVPKGVLAGIIDTFTKQTGITVKIHTVDHGQVQDQ